jgi:pyridoxal phosphate enzyme (YggS family)
MSARLNTLDVVDAVNVSTHLSQANKLMVLANRVTQVRERIANACQTYGRRVEDVHLLAVSKTQVSSEIEAAYGHGLCHFGENYLQEAFPKIMSLQHLPLCWHFIGHIQSNKTAIIAQHFDWVHSVASLRIALRLSQQRPAHLKPLQITLQVNIDQGTHKSGVLPTQVEDLARAVIELPKLRLRGLMAIPEAYAHFDEQKSVFERLAALLTQLRAKGLPDLDTLSMGMSDDLEAAIAAGATWVRVGSAIFGSRSLKT